MAGTSFDFAKMCHLVSSIERVEGKVGVAGEVEKSSCGLGFPPLEKRVAKNKPWF